jgi:hypothetical protein
MGEAIAERGGVEGAQARLAGPGRGRVGRHRLGQPQLFGSTDLRYGHDLQNKGAEMGVTNRGLDSPDETRTFDHGQVQVVKIGESTIGRYTFEPGWRWSESVKPIAKTDSCQAHHVGYILSGRLHVKTDDGGEAELGPGEAYEIHPGHDGWVVGDEAVTSVEFMGAEKYAMKG